MSALVKDIGMNVEVVGVRTYQLRFKTGVFLIKLAARIMGMQIKIQTINDYKAKTE